ncbi:MAG: hypothetical protein GX158_06045 [Bacteroidales bacterium]|jgi:hypothetical protein|nr:hypothetical protein [Bacteroidales bacterium]
MKKIILTTCLILLVSESAFSDVIYIPYPFTGVSYSAELIVSKENINRPKNTAVYWAGCGIVGSLLSGESLFGLESAIEGRHYFKPDQFRHFFLSAYLGAAFMTDLESFSSIGLVPGIKINYKANIRAGLVLEPYISLSLPITRELTEYPENAIFPAITFGARFGFNRLNDKR